MYCLKIMTLCKNFKIGLIKNNLDKAIENIRNVGFRYSDDDDKNYHDRINSLRHNLAVENADKLAFQLLKQGE